MCLMNKGETNWTNEIIGPNANLDEYLPTYDRKTRKEKGEKKGKLLGATKYYYLKKRKSIRYLVKFLFMVAKVCRFFKRHDVCFSTVVSKFKRQQRKPYHDY